MPIISGELSQPNTKLSGQRVRSTSVLLPGPHPKSPRVLQWKPLPKPCWQPPRSPAEPIRLANTTSSLRPGKYLVAASPGAFDFTPESIGKLWRSRDRFHEIDLPPNGAAQVNLDPVKIE